MYKEIFRNGVGITVGGLIWVVVFSILIPQGYLVVAIDQPFVDLGLAIGISIVLLGFFLIAYGFYLRGRKAAKPRNQRSCRRTTARF